MKTAEEKAKEFCDNLPLAIAMFRPEVEESVRLLLKEQDRNTRHACAESVIKLSRTMSQCSTVEFCNGFNAAICSAHDACMNARAV